LSDVNKKKEYDELRKLSAGASAYGGGFSQGRGAQNNGNFGQNAGNSDTNRQYARLILGTNTIREVDKALHLVEVISSIRTQANSSSLG